jgi:hypothetical protein
MPCRQAAGIRSVLGCEGGDIAGRAMNFKAPAPPDQAGVGRGRSPFSIQAMTRIDSATAAVNT